MAILGEERKHTPNVLAFDIFLLRFAAISFYRSRRPPANP
jgi:hypothetical protein